MCVALSRSKLSDGYSYSTIFDLLLVTVARLNMRLIDPVAGIAASVSALSTSRQSIFPQTEASAARHRLDRKCAHSVFSSLRRIRPGLLQAEKDGSRRSHETLK